MVKGALYPTITLIYQKRSGGSKSPPYTILYQGGIKMKKVLIFLLVLALAAGCVVPAGAEIASEYIVDEPTVYVNASAESCRVNLYEQLFADYCGFSDVEGTLEVYDYREVYHHDNDGTPDWVLVNSRSRDGLVGGGYGVFDELAVFSPESFPFKLGWGVYDIYANTFYSIEKAWDMGFGDLPDVFAHIAPQYDYTVFLGDVDHDGELSIIDSTHLQRFLVDIEELEYDTAPFEHCSADFGENQKYISDFNRDGERDITDVTAIQRHLVGLGRYHHRFTASVKLDTNSGLRAQARSSFTDEKVQYRYTIDGSFYAGSQYGTEFGAFGYDPEYAPEPGSFHITTGFIDADSVEIPQQSLTKGDRFILTVTARDQSGQRSVAKLPFCNCY